MRFRLTLRAGQTVQSPETLWTWLALDALRPRLALRPLVARLALLALGALRPSLVLAQELLVVPAGVAALGVDYAQLPVAQVVAARDDPAKPRHGRQGEPACSKH